MSVDPSLVSTASLLTPQQRSEQGLLRAIGREILRQLPPSEYAFSYGSSAMPQIDVKTNKSESLQSMLSSMDYNTGDKMYDIVLAVDNVEQWHDLNTSPGAFDNASHYSTFGRTPFMRKLTGLDSGVQYHPHVPILIQDQYLRDMGVPEVINVKYGITSMNTLVSDCLVWTQVYLAGRLHKPVTVLQDNPHMTIARELNLHHAVVYALLQLPEQFTELELFRTITQISYKGDIRTKVGAEDPEKVNNIVRGQLQYFRELYAPIISSYLSGISVNSNSMLKNASLTHNLPIYDYINTKPLDMYNTTPGSNTNQLSLFKYYHDVYSTLQNDVNDPLQLQSEQITFIQPTSPQHRAMLAASLPANLYAHRSISLAAINDTHRDALNQDKSAKTNKSTNYEGTMAERGATDGDHIGLTAPKIKGTETDLVAGMLHKDKLPPHYKPPQKTDSIEAELPFLPPCLTAIPFDSIAHTFGPNVLESQLASISPYIEYNRTNQLLLENIKLNNLLGSVGSTFMKQRLNSDIKLLSNTFIQNEVDKNKTTKRLNFHQGNVKQIEGSGNDDSTTTQKVLHIRNDTVNQSVESNVPINKLDIHNRNAMIKHTHRVKSLSTNDDGDDDENGNTDYQTTQIASPQSFLKISPNKFTMEKKKFYQQSAQPEYQKASPDHRKAMKSAQNSTLLANIQQLTLGNPLARFTSVYTTTVNDIVDIEQHKETAEQHTQYLLQVDQFKKTQQTTRSPLLLESANAVAHSMGELNPVPQKLVLPTINPLSITQALSHDTPVKVLNPNSAESTVIRAVEVDINATTNPSLTQANKFQPWNHFGDSSFSTPSVQASLPILPPSDAFQPVAGLLLGSNKQHLLDMRNKRIQLRKEIIDAQTSIKKMKNEINKKMTEQKTIEAKSSSSASSADNSLMVKNIETSLATISAIEVNIREKEAILASNELNYTSSHAHSSTLDTITATMPSLWAQIRDMSSYMKQQLDIDESKLNETQQGADIAADISYFAGLQARQSFVAKGIIIPHGSVTRTSDALKGLTGETILNLQTNLSPNRQYLGHLGSLQGFYSSENLRRLQNIPDYSLKQAPSIALSKKGNDTLFIVAQNLYPGDHSPAITKVDRAKLQQDPWYYDRLSLPKFHNTDHTAAVEMTSLLQNGALPEGGVNRFSDRRQRWQTETTRMSDGEGYEAFQSELNKIIADDISSIKSKHGCFGQDNNVGAQEEIDELKLGYNTSLANPFVNIGAAAYDPRRAIGGVARFDNSVNALQVIVTTKFPLFSAYLQSNQLRKFWFNMYKHDITTPVISAQYREENVQNTEQQFTFNQHIQPLTSMKTLQTFTTDNEFIHNYLLSDTNKSNRITTKPFKNFEYTHIISEWEEVFKGLQSVPGSKFTPVEQVNSIINNKLQRIVGSSSKVQTIMGFFSAGPVKSIKYAIRKLKKGRKAIKKQQAKRSMSTLKHHK